jgi:aminoglycoside phosphotransferase (APT) family kinase protein
MMSAKTFSEITPAWLTAILTERGGLIAGRVLRIDQTRDPNPITQNATLRLTYSPDARGACPDRLFFKQNPEAAEAKFYQKIAPTLAHSAVPVCYDAQYDDASSHVLLAFVEPTHFAPPEALPMPLVYHEMIVDALADLHSQFWDHARLRQDIGALARDVPAFSFAVASQHWAAFVDALGDRLSATRRGTYERILRQYPRYRPSGPKTLVHGDAHWGNYLYPHDPIVHNLYLIDWAVWHVNHGVGDLAYNIALQCYPERRAWIEQPLVRRYHARLLANDIHDYAWAQCWEDYRRMVIEQCVWPIVWHHFDLSPNVWWFALECTLAAFDDLHCEEFL